jgi:type VI secretion system secreted protein VgrG
MWFFSANEAQFLFTVDGCSEELGVLRFSGEEALGKNYCFDIDVVCDSDALDIMALQHQTACLTLQNTPQPRFIHGIVLSAGHIKTDNHHHHYRFRLAPQAELLHYRTNQRIFQQQSVTDIIQNVWQQAGLNPAALRVQTTHPQPLLSYCVQYDETDLHFLQRLCEWHGLFYYFEHTADQHTMVFVDGQEHCAKVAPVSYQPDSGQNPDNPILSQFDWQFTVTAEQASVDEYDFTRPRFALTGNTSYTGHEWYQYGTQHDAQSLAATQASLILAQQQHERQRILAHSNVRNIYPGSFLPVNAHPEIALNLPWFVVSVHHKGEQPQVLKELAEGRSSYQNRVRLQHKNVRFALPCTHNKPQPCGFQTALVTGPENQEIYTDEYGRIKVQFHWDRDGSLDEKTSCWLRVAQGWAGANYGQQFLPRTGQEVIVAFLEHDIDRPYVIGCVHNVVNTPSIQYPANQSQSGFRTRSSPDSSGFNELRFEDKKGQEQIVLHAQRNWYRKVKRTSRTEIGANEHLWIGGKDLRQTSGEAHLTINKNRLTNISGNQDLHILQNHHLHINQKWLSKIDQELHIKTGQTIVLEAATAMSFDAGGSTLILDNSGIKLQGSTIRINSGGATAPALFPSQVKMLLPTALSAIKIATFKKKTFSEECEKITDDICNFGSQAKGSKSDQDSTLINTGTNSFTLEQKQKIQEAIYNQKTMLSNKKEELIRWNENDQEKFKSAFGTTDENARKTILYRVNKEIEYNKSLNLNSFDKTNENIYAKIEGWKDHGKIHLGEKFWTNSKNDGAESTAGVLSHEISHIYNIGPTQDHFPDYNHGKDIYYKENSHMLANKRPDLALKHADSFEYYLEDK